MMIINISEAKANLSKLVNMACHGEEVIIAKNNLPLVEIVPHKMKGKRKLGILAGRIDVPDDIMDEDEVLNEMFYGREEGEEAERQ
ncbi:MAG: type II toxin-antitoxin system prevent-host-death family antitoxin [Candidatus Electrothrix sp. AUS1_2]|nr:type II toxin-antitoxin system prevent-host-death family antitoxin [Candidatus Electrothrix sp. AUS1_2]